MSEVFIGNFLRTILTMSICGSVIALLLFALRPVIKDKASKAAQYYLWLIVIAQLIIPFSASLPVNRTLTAPSGATAGSSYEVMFPQYNRPVYSMRDALDRYAFSTEEEMNRVADVANSVGVGSPMVSEAQNRLPVNVIDILMVLWPIGAALFLLITLSSYFAFVRNLKKGLIPTDIQAEVRARRIPVYKSSSVKTPMLIGVFRARIVLPDKDYEPAQLNSILQHEITHLKRHDLLIKWLTVFANAIHWFNPLVYLVRKEMNRACELSCDEAVIKQLNLNERQIYGDTLISVVADSRYPVGVVSTTMCEDKKKLKERLKSIMNYKQSTKIAACLTVVLALTLTVSAIAMSASTADRTERGTIKLDSTKLSDMPVDAIMKGIMDITGAKSDDIVLSMDGTYDFRISPDYQWDELANTLRILVSMKETGGAPYICYQVQFDSRECDIDIFRIGESPAPQYSYKLRHLLDALKHIPTDILNAAFDSPPDMIMIHGSRDEKIESGRPMIYYDVNGVKSESGWLQHLAITPMYGDEDGGTQGVSSDVVHLFYSDPDSPESPVKVRSTLPVLYNADFDGDGFLDEIRGGTMTNSNNVVAAGIEMKVGCVC